MIIYSQFRKPVLRPPFESGQYLSIRYSERLMDAGVDPFVGSKGDSYDNALAETINGLLKQKSFAAEVSRS